MILVIYFLATLFGIEARTIADNKCIITLSYKNGDLQEPQPLILIKNRTTYDFLYPQENNGTLNLNSFEKFHISCPGKNNYIRGIEGLKNTSQIEVQCLRNKTFINEKVKFNFTSVKCKYLPIHEARRTKDICYNNASLVKIGFNLKESFLTTIEVCRDDESSSTYYTKFLLSKNIGSFHAGFPRPSWKSGDFYDDYDIDYQYKVTTQFLTVKELVGSDELASDYINSTSRMYMSRGHLTAKADFVYGSAQTSTFWYLNAAPQWQTFNGGNWNSLEDSVRKFSQKKSLDLMVYTGIYGQMTLSDINGNDVPIYLYVKGDDRGIRVPKYYWKIIYDPLSMRGTAFIGVNDPFADKTSDVFLCGDISEEIKWLSWDSKNIRKGISYACSIDDLREIIPFIPSFYVKGILY